MYIRIFNILMFLLIVAFIFVTYKYYSSSKNMNVKNYNRLNINEILKEKINNLPELSGDTNDVIVFNNSIENGSDEKKRSFWELLKDK